MEIIYNPPLVFLIITLGVIVIVVPTILLKKSPKWKKIMGLSSMVIILGLFLFLFYRTTHLTVTDKGIYTDTFGKQNIHWEDIKQAVLIKNLKETEYNPTLRIGGNAWENFKTGWFMLKNGTKAFLVQEKENTSILIKTNETTYLFGPENFEPFRAELEKYITLEKKE